MWSSAPEASVLPSGLVATVNTVPVWPTSDRLIGGDAVRSHRLIGASYVPEKSTLPSTLNATLDTPVASSMGGSTGLCVATFHRITAPTTLSSLPAANVFPSELNARLFMLRGSASLYSTL